MALEKGVPPASRGVVPGSSKGWGNKGDTRAGREGPSPRYLNKENRRQPEVPIIRHIHSLRSS